MNRNEAIARLKKREPELRRLGVRHLYLFGPTARGDARDDSNADLFSIMHAASSVSSS